MAGGGERDLRRAPAPVRDAAAVAGGGDRAGAAELGRAEVGQRQGLARIAAQALRRSFENPVGGGDVHLGGGQRPGERPAPRQVAELQAHPVAGDGDAGGELIARAHRDPDRPRGGGDNLVPDARDNLADGGAVGFATDLLQRLGGLAVSAQAHPDR